MTALELPVFYSFRRCPYAMRARLALAVSEQPCELREVVLRAKPPQLLAASPKGTVPVLVLPDGAVIDQSLDIMRWALNRHDPQHWLAADPDTAAQYDALIEQCDGPFKTHLDRYKYPVRYDNVDPLTHRAAAGEILGAWDERLRRTDHLFGPRPCLADMAIAPFVRQFAQVEPQWFDQQPWPELQRWLKAFLSTALFQRIMHKYAAWEVGTETVTFPPQC
ncbi:glutathione S-transferase [Bordetella sp. 15P40C-2]|uniref:glutathione S-transferase n=1 Tax=Bordetella sp. 15P40C-2 TaxID=2572246 RepID=UPI001322AFBF|nr:glutathione S-transferase [Bordetella sp. 15P40C-2]MVW70299.1 glutathione S-transferase [Bordetella sp. 15P40C-2]